MTRRPRRSSIGELIRGGGRSFSFEFFPPKDEAGEEQLWRAISALEPSAPTFVSVTYGAGGTTRDSTVRVTARIVRETSLTPMAHLTCVGHTRDELDGDPGRLRRGRRAPRAGAARGPAATARGRPGPPRPAG